MKALGGLMVFFGVGSIVLYFMEREFTLLSWIDKWGEGAAWGIRAGLIVVGGLLFMMGRSQGQRQQQSA